jgi:hypothetical protein
MASDNDWNAGEFGGWNQRKVGIEVEGMRDLDMIFTQMAAQFEARA